MPARTACCSAFQPLHAAVSRQFRDKPWRKWGGHTRSHTIDRFKNRASELNTPTQSNINKERVHFCCAMINHPTQYGCQKHTHTNQKKSFAKIFLPRAVTSFRAESHLATLYFSLLPSFFSICLSLALLIPFVSSSSVSGSSSLLSLLFFVCPSQISLKHSRNHSTFFQHPHHPISLDLSPPYHTFTLFLNTVALCVSPPRGLGGTQTLSPPWTQSQRPLLVAATHPIAHRCSRDFPSMCVRLCAAVSMSYR